MTIGRISVDIYGKEDGAGLEDPQTFRKAVGGSPTNVAIGAARYGHKTAVITGVGNDSLGKFAVSELRKFKVDTEFVSVIPGKTPIVIAGLKDADNPELVFYREPNAPDTQMEVTEKMKNEVLAAKYFWFTGSTLSNPKLRKTVMALLSTRAAVPNNENIFDLDYRATFWSDEAEAHEEISGVLGQASVVIGNRKECSVATGLPTSSDLQSFADSLLMRGARLAIIKDGANGVLVSDMNSSTMVPGISIKVRCGLGAGDAFGAGVVHGLLNGWGAAEIVRFANAAGAHVASQLMCSDAMPTELEVNTLLGNR